MPIYSDVEMSKAVESRDKSFDGRFYYGITTTGIFCQPSCSAKPAKPQHVSFFSSIEEAMAAGFRPCKRCHPVVGDARVERLIEVVRHMEAHADQKMTLTSLGAMAGLSPSQLQKQFKKTFGISPKLYQDALRLHLFKHSLTTGEGVTDAIYAAGFGSVSRVYGEASRNIGMQPKVYRAGGEGERISYACRTTKLGLMMMAATDKGVCFVQFNDNEAALFADLKIEFPKARLLLSASQHAPALDRWIDALDQHISHDAPIPELPLDIRGTVFQTKVWQFLISIQEGETLSYGEVAEKMGTPSAARAVGTACGKNSIALLIPCHRVLRGDGSLGGYRWGLSRKQALLDKEKRAT